MRSGRLALLLVAGAGLAAPSAAQTFPGTNQPGGEMRFDFVLAPGVTNLSLSVSNNASSFSHLYLKQGEVAATTNYDAVARLNGLSNALNLEGADVVAGTNYSLLVRTPTNSAAHAFSVLLLTNRAGFRTLAFPVAEPVVFTVSGALNRGETNVFQVDVPTNMPGWRLVLTASGTADPDIYLRVGAIPTAAQYTKRSINRPVDTIFLSDTEATNQTYFITVVLPASDLGVASYTLSTELSAVIPLAWDPGTNAAGTLVYTNQSLLGGDHFFRMTAQDAALGVWRTRLHVLSNEADLFLRRGNLPTVTTYDYSSTRLGDDGVALVQGGQFASNDVWYVLVYAPPGAQWLLYSGNAYVATLPTPGLDESGGTNLVVEPEGMNFYRTVMGTNIIAWRLGLNGLTNAVLVRTNKLAHPYSAAYYNWNQPGQMLLVPSYHYSDILSDFHFSSSFIRRFRWDW